MFYIRIIYVHIVHDQRKIQIYCFRIQNIDLTTVLKPSKINSPDQINDHLNKT